MTKKNPKTSMTPQAERVHPMLAAARSVQRREAAARAAEEVPEQLSPQEAWERAKQRGLITADGERVMLTMEEIEAVYTYGRESGLDSAAWDAEASEARS